MKIYQSGQVLIITIFILGLVAIAIVMSLATTGVGRVIDSQSETSGEKALYAARAGIEETLYRLQNDINFGNGTPATISNNTLDDTAYIATISGDDQKRIATSTGILNKNIKKLEIQLNASSSAGRFVIGYAVQAGSGGITMNNNSQISATDGGPGNVFSNGTIIGNQSATIIGNAWAVGGINPDGGSITITKDAYGPVIKDCTVLGNTYSPGLPTNCTVSGSKVISPAPTPISFPAVDTTYWQNAAEVGGTIASYNLPNGQTASLGPKKITGDVTLNNNSILTLDGPLWVYGTFLVKGGAQLKLSESFGKEGTVVLLDHPTDKVNNGKVIIESNAIVTRTTQGGYILFISTHQSSDCSNAAGAFSAGGAATAIIAPDGCVTMNSSGNLVGLAANQIQISQQSTVTYDSGWSSELYVPGPGIGGSGGLGWSIISWKEVP